MFKSRKSPLFRKSPSAIWEPCLQCFGYGEDICPECESEGCIHCDQRGYTTCRMCRGMGEVRVDELTWRAVQG